MRSSAVRTAWMDYTWFEVADLLRAAVYITAMSATMTTPSTTRVTISSTMVKPAAVAPGRGVLRNRSMRSRMLLPHVRDRLDGIHLLVLPAHGRRDPPQVGTGRRRGEQLGDGEDADREHHQRDHQLEQRGTALGAGTGVGGGAHGGPQRKRTRPDIWTVTASRSPRRLFRTMSPEPLSRPPGGGGRGCA